MSKALFTILFTILVIGSVVPAAHAASVDGTVEWDGVSHVPRLDRRPLCPVDGEEFEVRFQTYRGDLTEALVHVDDGSTFTVAAGLAGARGPYTIWSATIPSTWSDAVSYYLEMVDGADSDYYGASGMSETVPPPFVVNFTTLEHAPLGATPVTGGTVFRVWSPATGSAHVRGDFNGWGLGNPMTRVGEDFIARVAGAAPGQMYKYYFNNAHWNTDPRARRLNPGDNYNADIEDPFGYTWTAAGYETPPLEQMVIYQLHVGTFAGRNDPYGAVSHPSGFSDVAARVSHLAELGVNAIMLNPVTEFPWDVSAGYNPVTQWSPEWIYGTPDEFKQMVDACHARGIAVLLDIVWNHVSYSDNFLWSYDGTQLYFDDPVVDTPWGAQADFDRNGVRDYYADSAYLWMEEYRVDGFRMDATDYMNIGAQEAAGWSLMQRFTDEMHRRYADRVAIAEQLPDDSWVTRPTAQGGAGFDAQYHDAFTDQLRQEILDAAFGDPEMWRIRNIVDGSGENMAGSQVVNYLELHDEAWPNNGGQRMVKSIDTTAPHDDIYARSRTKLAQGLVLLAPGVPALLQGTEWLEDTDWGDAYDNRIDWSKKTTYADVFAYYRDIITLRRERPAFFADAPHTTSHVNEGGNVIGFERRDADGNHFFVLANFSNTDYANYRVGLPAAGVWTEVLNSEAPAYGGSAAVNSGDLATDGIPYDGFDQSLALSLPARGLVVISNHETAIGVPGDRTEIPSVLAAGPVAPNPARAAASLSFTLPAEAPARAEVFDVRGRRIARLLDDTLNAGEHMVTWDGRDAYGERTGGGIFFIRVSAGSHMVTRKLLRLP